MQLFSVLEASRWATDYIGKNVTTKFKIKTYFKKGDSKNFDTFAEVKKRNVEFDNYKMVA